MKRLFLILFLAVIVPARQAQMLLAIVGAQASTVVASGSVSLANLRLSTKNGYAFVDFSAAGAPTPYLNDYPCITASSQSFCG